MKGETGGVSEMKVGQEEEEGRGHAAALVRTKKKKEESWNCK